MPLRPLGLGEILDASVSYIRRYPRTTLGLATAVAVVNGLVQVVVLGVLFASTPSITESAIDPSTGTSTSTEVALNVVQVLQTGLTLLLQIIATGMLTYVMGQAVLGRPAPAREAWRRVRSIFWRLIGVAALTALLVVVAFVVFLLPGLAVLALGGGPFAIALLVLGGIVGACAAVWTFVVLILAPPALVLERTNVRGALRRSRTLVAGSFWRVLGISLLAAVLANVIASILLIPFGLLGAGGGFVIGDSGDATFQSAMFGAAIGTAVGTIVTLPFAAGVTSLLYIDRRMRREGLDLELVRAAGAGQPPPAAPPGTPPPPPAVQQW